MVGGRLGLRWVRVQGAAIWRISCCGVGNGGVLVALESGLWEFEGRAGAAIDDSGGGVGVGRS